MLEKYNRKSAKELFVGVKFLSDLTDKRIHNAKGTWAEAT